jgi:hypothetical protein
MPEPSQPARQPVVNQSPWKATVRRALPPVSRATQNSAARTLTLHDARAPRRSRRCARAVAGRRDHGESLIGTTAEARRRHEKVYEGRTAKSSTSFSRGTFMRSARGAKQPANPLPRLSALSASCVRVGPAPALFLGQLGGTNGERTAACTFPTLECILTRDHFLS